MQPYHHCCINYSIKIAKIDEIKADLIIYSASILLECINSLYRVRYITTNMSIIKNHIREHSYFFSIKNIHPEAVKFGVFIPFQKIG